MNSTSQSKPRLPLAGRRFLTICAIVVVALAISIPLSSSISTKFSNGFAAMEEREVAECEAKGGTYRAQPLYAYATSCVSESGHYLHLDAYSQVSREKS